MRLKHQFGNQDRNYVRKVYVPNPSYQPRPASSAIEAVLGDIEDSVSRFTWIPTKRRNLNQLQVSTLKMLRARPDLKIVITDKNLGPALFTRSHYIDLCISHLSDTKTYCLVTAPQDALEKLIRTRVRAYYATIARRHSYDADWNHTKVITADLDSKHLNRFYALAKIHKPTLQIRPIVANSGSILEGLSKWLDYRLQPYLLRTRAYLRNSDQVVEDLRSIPWDPGDILYTVDVESLYTNIPIDPAISIINERIAEDPWRDAITAGLQVIMKNNYFRFGDTIWHQLYGTAMGTPAAPVFASLYLAHFEEIVLAEFAHHVKWYGRYLDDILIIWRPHGQAFALKRLLAKMTMLSKLRFTIDEYDNAAPFLDLWIHHDDNKFFTKTHQKKLNLYLYLPSNSAHPPGVLKGMIIGLIKKYKFQNPRFQDFKHIVRLLLRRLLARGYDRRQLLPLFEDALKEKPAQTTPSPSPLIFKLQYDPNGPSRSQLRRVLQLDRLEDVTGQPIRICYTKPATLRTLLCPTELSTSITPTPADALQAAVQGSG